MKETITPETNNGHKPNGTIVIDRDLPLVKPDGDLVVEREIEPGNVTSEPIDIVDRLPPKRNNKLPFILAGLGVGAIAASIFGYRYWQFAATHQSTDNATVAGHIHQISSKVNGTVAQVLVNDNQQVQPGQLLVKLDPNDYQNKVAQAQAALAAARGQASAAQANIALASQTSSGRTAQAQGDIGNAQAAIATAQAAAQEAQAGVPAAQAAVAQAQSGISAANAAVKEAQSSIPSAEAALAEAQAGVPVAQAQVSQFDANLARAKADFQRYQSLRNSGAVSQQQLETARAAYQSLLAQRQGAVQGVSQANSRVAQARQAIDAARARLAQAQENVAKAKSQYTAALAALAQARARVPQAQEGIASARSKLASTQGALEQAQATGQQTTANRSQYAAAQAAIGQSQAALKDAQLQLSYTNIAAPSAGRVGRKNVEVGNRIQSGTPLMAIVDNDYWVVANFKETQLDAIKPKQVVEVKLDAFPSRTFKGYVDSVSPASGAQFSLLPPDNATGNFTKIVQRIPVKISLDPNSIKGYESQITPGMSAEVTVETQ